MELKKFINTLQQNVGVRTLLPLNQGLIYPYFVRQNGKLCAHFLGNASNIMAAGMVLHTPAYHVVASYPKGEVLCVENLQYNPAFRNVDFSETTLLIKKTPQQREEAKAQMAKLAQLAEEVLQDWENADLEAYHAQLFQVLTQQQVRMYRKVAGCD